MAVDMFLKIEGIPGESQDAKHKDEIEVESFSWGVTNPADDKVSVQDFQFASRVNKASPILMLSCATGKHIGDAVLTVRKAGEDQQEFLVIKMKPVFVTSYQTGGSAGDIVPVDSFSLNFEEIKVQYFPQRADGKLGEPVEAGFNVKDLKR